MVTILLRNPIVAGGRRLPGFFLRLLHHEPFSKPFSTSPSSPNSDLAVSFFRNSCGLSPSAALAAAAEINMKLTENSESVLSLLQTYGFTKSNIALIAAKFPVLFSSYSEKSIKPKLDLFISAGFTGDFIVKLFSKYPCLLKYSLQKKLGPNLHLLMTTLGGDMNVVATSIASSTRILTFDFKNNMLPNIETLREHGAGANIARLFRCCPRTVTLEPERFSKCVAFLQDIGFDPSHPMFIHGFKVMAGHTPPAWERKLQLYRSLGWSQEETLSAFKKSPTCMGISEEKVRKTMAFCVENLKWEPSHLATMPRILSFSFEKRIVPRCVVFNVLSTSGLSRTNIKFASLISMSESDFLKYLYKYSDAFPKLLEDYKVKLDATVAVPSNCVI